MGKISPVNGTVVQPFFRLPSGAPSHSLKRNKKHTVARIELVKFGDRPSNSPDFANSIKATGNGNSLGGWHRARSTIGFLIFLFVSTLTPQAALAIDAEWAPEAASGISTSKTVLARQAMAVTANPHATQAATAMLRQGGSAIDAAIAAQVVLGLVEPQSSGIGGGAFLLHWDAGDSELIAYDGRETAPQLVDAKLFMLNEQPMNFFDAVVGGRSVGTPGLLKMLAKAHRQQGKLAWSQLFAPAIQLAEEGFLLSPRLFTLLDWITTLDKPLDDSTFKAHFYNSQGRPLAIGTRLKNPQYAASLRLIAKQGGKAFYQGKLAQQIVDSVNKHPDNPGHLSLKDLSNYQAIARQALCRPFYQYRVCGAPPPSSGASTLLAILGILELQEIDKVAPHSADFIHLFSEASKLAFADRNTYIADPDFGVVPTKQLIAERYLQQRSQKIKLQRSLGKAQPGQPAIATSLIESDSPELPSTSHLSIIDKEGNIVSMTSSIETAFGSRVMVGGFLLNNQLTDFSFSPNDQQGKRVANRVEPGKRPRSSMAPTIVFDRKMNPVLIIGSPGGSRIINYVARVIIETLVYGISAEQSISGSHIVNMNRDLEIEPAGFKKDILNELERRGHTIKQRSQTSGIHAIWIDNKQLHGVADPRREGSAEGI